MVKKDLQEALARVTIVVRKCRNPALDFDEHVQLAKDLELLDKLIDEKED